MSPILRTNYYEKGNCEKFSEKMTNWESVGGYSLFVKQGGNKNKTRIYHKTQIVCSFFFAIVRQTIFCFAKQFFRVHCRFVKGPVFWWTIKGNFCVHWEYCLDSCIAAHCPCTIYSVFASFSLILKKISCKFFRGFFLIFETISHNFKNNFINLKKDFTHFQKNFT